MKKAYNNSLLLHALVMIIFNWGGLTIGESFDIYNDREMSFWATLILTFPLVLFTALSIYWLYLSLKHEWKLQFYVHVLVLLGILIGLTELLNQMALIPVQYEYKGQWWWPSDWRENLIGILNEYLEAYQPLNFVLAALTGGYWSVILIRRFNKFSV